MLELLVASVCTTLVAGAVLSLLVGTAVAGRRQWGELAARSVSGAAVSSVAEDLRVAGIGMELADAVQIAGQRIPLVASGPTTALRAVLPAGGVHEIWSYLGASVFLIEAAGAPGVGRLVAAVDQPARAAGAPLPVGTVVGTTRRGGFVELSVAWRAPEATLLSAWGPPRAVVPLRLREYEARSVGGAVALRRRDDGGSWQPIGDGLDRFDVSWIVDTDADGVADVRQATWTGGSGTLCAVQLEARVSPTSTRLAGSAAAAGSAPRIARRWIRLEGC